jgi:heme b synthase
MQMAMQTTVAGPRLVFWETTKACNLSCAHCRAVPQAACSPRELTTADGCALLDQLADGSKPVVILSGGEPLYRPDVYELGRHGAARGLRMALATNGTLITRGVARSIADAGFQRVAISLDGADPRTHDRFRGVPGAHARALDGLRLLREAGLSTQINSSIARHNVSELPRLLELAASIGADALHIFMLVPVGCGLTIAQSQMLSAREYEAVLHWFYDMSDTVPLELKATCAPHYFRVRAQRTVAERRDGNRSATFRTAGRSHPLHAMTRGCLAGTGVCFVSHEGDVYPCGYLPVTAGNVRRTRFDEIWQTAGVFRDLRNLKGSGGKCGACRYEGICGGCRARAYGATGDYMAGEPYCVYDPLAES